LELLSDTELNIRSNAALTARGVTTTITGTTLLELLSDTELNIRSNAALTARGVTTTITGTEVLNLISDGDVNIAATDFMARVDIANIATTEVLNLTSETAINVLPEDVLTAKAATAIIIGTDRLNLLSDGSINIMSPNGEINITCIQKLAAVATTTTITSTEVLNLLSDGRIEATATAIYINGKSGLQLLSNNTIEIYPTYGLITKAQTTSITCTEFLNLKAEKIISLDSDTFNMFTETGGTIISKGYLDLSASRMNISAAEMVNFNPTILSLIASKKVNMEAASTFNMKAGTSASVYAVEGIKIESGDKVEIESLGSVNINTSSRISLRSNGTIFPVPSPIEGNGALISDDGFPVEGDLFFDLPNVLTCVDGVLKVVTFTVNIVVEG
jgi:hypothetical protein